MGTVIDFNDASDTLRKLRMEKEASKAAGSAARARHEGGEPLRGNLDSSDDWELYHVYHVEKDDVWEVWLPYDNACMITFDKEERTRQFARDLNALIGSGVAVYTGVPPVGPSYA